jgi:hypothetical protein
MKGMVCEYRKHCSGQEPSNHNYQQCHSLVAKVPFLRRNKYQHYNMGMCFAHNLLQTSCDVLEMPYFNFQTWNDTPVVPFSVSLPEMLF